MKAFCRLIFVVKVFFKNVARGKGGGFLGNFPETRKGSARANFVTRQKLYGNFISNSLSIKAGKFAGEV